MTDRFTLHLGDCLDVLRAMPDASVDAVVTDPPYGLGKAPIAPRRAHSEAHGDDRDPGSSMQTVLTLVPSTEAFDCPRKGERVTYHGCHDGYMDANSGFRRVTSPCLRCPKGASHRAAMAVGA